MRTSAYSNPRRRTAGSAVIVVIALLAILFIYVGANLSTLRCLGRDIKLIERHQLRHWTAVGQRTNTAVSERVTLLPGDIKTNQ